MPAALHCHPREQGETITMLNAEQECGAVKMISSM
jgi:hypothetical protein